MDDKKEKKEQKERPETESTTNVDDSTVDAGERQDSDVKDDTTVEADAETKAETEVETGAEIEGNLICAACKTPRAGHEAEFKQESPGILRHRCGGLAAKM